LLLPARIRDPAYALYAFCRLSDDAIDVEGGRAAVLARLRDRLDRAYDGRPLPLAVDRALADTVERFEIPKALPAALLEGLEWDAQGRRYASLSELTDYSARVAGSVGAMMALLMGVRTPDMLARACDLGVAMQLTNIARDVGEDARNGRIYLPLDWLAREGIDPDRWLAAPRCVAPVRRIVQDLLAAADALYARADTAISRLPFDCRPGIAAARTLYAEVGREVERRGLDSVSSRAVVPNARKVALLAGALPPTFLPRGQANGPALPETAFLVAAVTMREPAPRLGPPWWNLHAQAIGAIEIFDSLERRDRKPRETAISTRLAVQRNAERVY
jgi:phytoene synthase